MKKYLGIIAIIAIVATAAGWNYSHHQNGLIQSCLCKKNKNAEYFYSLLPSKDRIIIPIDDNSNCYSISMFTYNSAGGSSFLSIENDQTNELIFYNLDSCKLSHKIKIELEGPNAIGHIFGHHVINLDTILVYSPSRLSIYKINNKGNILDTYSLQSNSNILVAHPPVSKVYNPMIKIDSCVYLCQALMHRDDGYNGDDLEKYPLCIEVNLNSKQSKTMPLKYPRLWERKNIYNKYTYSRDFDGNNFIYSFYISNFLYVTSNNKTFEKYSCKSKHIKNDPKDSYNPDIAIMRKEGIENESYGTIIYDKYRKVYYRFFYPQYEIKPSENISVLTKTKKQFSILIIDSNFNIIGESLFPENQYIPEMLFINKNGLYICDNNFNNSLFNEDILSFRKIDLIKTN